MAKVLVVDDEDSIIWIFRRLVEGLGHAFLSAPTGEKGIEIAREDQPDLIFMDVKLPGMDGLTALEEVRLVAPRAKYVVMTAHGTLDTAVRAMKLGAVEYLAKPVDLDQARALILGSLKGAGVNREVEALRKAGGLSGIVGKSADHAGSLQEDRGRRRQRRDRAPDRRERHGKGAAGPGGALQQLPRERAVRGDQLRVDPRDASRERALRP